MSDRPQRTLAARIFYRFCWIFCVFVCALLFRLRLTGRERLPRDGPYLLLSNHTSALDPVWVGVGLVRPANFMASEALFRVPGLSWLITALGAFPKQKFVRDNAAMDTLSGLYRAGGVIVMFPEGTRTWDGRAAPIRGGIGALIKQLDARVVFARNRTGFLVHPRWARYPRFVPLDVEYSEPFTFPASMSHDEIAEIVRKQISVDPAVRARRPAFGARLAEGLPDYLWACFSCFAVGGLSVDPEDRDQVRCGGCGRRYRVTVDARLIDEAGAATMIGDAFDAIDQRFGAPPRLGAPGQATLLRAETCRLSRLVRGQARPEPVAEGRLELTEDTLSVLAEDGQIRWSSPLRALRAVSVEVGNQLRLLPPDEVLVLDPHGQSTLMWSHVLRGWIHHAKGGVGEPPPG